MRFTQYLKQNKTYIRSKKQKEIQDSPLLSSLNLE